jgi:hypothetical protein
MPLLSMGSEEVTVSSFTIDFGDTPPELVSCDDPPPQLKMVKEITTSMGKYFIIITVLLMLKLGANIGNK